MGKTVCLFFQREIFQALLQRFQKENGFQELVLQLPELQKHLSPGAFPKAFREMGKALPLQGNLSGESRKNSFPYHVYQNSYFYVRGVHVLFETNIVVRENFPFGHNVQISQKSPVFRVQIEFQPFRSGLGYGEPPPDGLFHPFFTVAISFETDLFALQSGMPDGLERRFLEIRGLHLFLHDTGHLVDSPGPGRENRRERACDGLGGSGSPEFELVPREGDGSGAVAVRVFRQNTGKPVQSQVHLAFGGKLFRQPLLDILEDPGEKLSEIDAHHRRRRFIASQAVHVAGIGDACPEQSSEFGYSQKHPSEKNEKLQAFFRVVSQRFQEIPPLAVLEGKIDVLAVAVQSRKGFFVQQKSETVFSGYLTHHFHEKLVLVRGEIGFGELGSELELSRSHFVMPGPEGKSEPGHRLLHLLHERKHRGIDGSEIMIFHLLSLGRQGSQEGTAAEQNVRPLLGEIFPNEEKFLFRSHGGAYPFDSPVSEETYKPESPVFQAADGLEKRGFHVQGSAVVGEKDRRNAESASPFRLYEKSGACGIPCGISPGFEGGAHSSRGKGGGIGFAENKLLS